MKHRYIVTGIFILFVILRLYFIFTFPPFTDESLYIRWGQMTVYHPLLHWITIEYLSRQPLGMWIFGFGAIIFKHPLFGARLMMFFCNLPIFFIVWDIAQRMFSKSVAVFSLFLLSIVPLFIQMQSLAILDGFEFTLAGIILWIYIRPTYFKLPFYSVLTGISIGTGLWIKSTGLLIFPILFVADFWKWKTEKIAIKNLLIHMSIVLTISIGIAFQMYFLGHAEKLLSEPDSFTFTIKELIHFPIIAWLLNLHKTLIGILIYCSPVIVFALFALVNKISYKKYVIFLIWFLIPVFVAIITSRSLILRYFYSGTLGFILIGGIGLDTLYQKISKRFTQSILLCLIVYGLFFTIFPLQFFRLFPKANAEREYAIGWTSGYGMFEMTNWIDQRMPPGKKLVLVISDVPGNPEDYIGAYYYFNPQVLINHISISDPDKFKELKKYTPTVPLYLVARKSQLNDYVLERTIAVIEYQYPYDTDIVGLYEIKFPEQIQ